MADTTPRPWEWAATDGSLLCLGTVGKADAEGAVLACTRCKACQQDEHRICLWPNEANAALIVRCVNSHDALVEACQRISDAPYGVALGDLEFLRAALAAAKEE